MNPSTNGTFATSDTTTNNISVITDNASGYTLSLSAKTANNYDLVHDTNNKLTPIPSSISASTFESSTAHNNMWGIRPSKYNSADNTNYYPLSGTALVLDETSTANPSTANNYNLAVGVRATSAKAPGDYTNTITVTAIANKTNYSIAYNNPSGAASGMPASTSGSTYDETVAISSTSPTRSGYAFRGWCTNSVGVDAGEMPSQTASASTSAMLQGYNYKRDEYSFLGWSTVKNPTIGTDTIYGPMEDITTPSTMSTTGLTLYAVWLPKSTTYNMQNFSSSTCSSQLTKMTYNSSNATFTAPASSFIALEDTRDHNVYTVARMPDGNCWMLENLRLDESATGINTDALSQNGASFTISVLPTSINSFAANNTAIQYNKSNTDINNSSLTASYNANDTTTSKWYGHGNYYSWAAARGTTSALSSGDTTTSICPKNWRLPIGNNSIANYSFGKLSTSIGGTSAIMNTSTTPTGAVMSARIRQFPVIFLYSGRSGTSSNFRGSYGYYWSSAIANGYYIYGLILDSSWFSLDNTITSFMGDSIRCVVGS